MYKNLTPKSMVIIGITDVSHTDQHLYHNIDKLLEEIGFKGISEDTHLLIRDYIKGKKYIKIKDIDALLKPSAPKIFIKE